MAAGDGDGKMMRRKEQTTGPWKIDYSGDDYPVYMKNLSTPDLEQLAAELRAEIVYTMSKTGGHLSSSLGVMELAVALQHVFNTP